MKRLSIMLLILTIFSLSVFSYSQIVGIDASGFPAIRLYVSTDEGDITGVSDNGEYMNFFAQKLSSLEHSVVDIAFIFDTTNSMSDEINSLYHGIEQFAANLSSTGVGYRLALITFGDEIRQVYNFTSDVNEFRDWVRMLNVDMGGDKKESSLDAMVKGLTLSYNPNAQKIMVLVTDAAPHERNDGTVFSSVTKGEVVSALGNFGINLFTLSPYPFEEIARQLGGHWRDINKNRNFLKVLDMISGIIVQEYAVDYTVNDLTPDLTHNVTVRAISESFGNYISPPSNQVAITTTKVISSGIGAIPEQFIGEPWGFISARKAAIADAQKRMLEIVKGVNLRGGQTIRNGILTDARMTAAVNGWLNGAYVIEEKYMPNVYLYEVKLALDLLGETGLINILRDLESYDEAMGNSLETNILMTDLANGWVKASGYGIINKYDSKGTAIYKARAAAIADAQTRLLETIKGAYVESNVQVETTMTDVEITKTFEGVIRGAEVITESVLAESLHGIEGLYKVEMGVSLTERLGIMGIMLNELGIPENQKISESTFMAAPQKQTVETSPITTVDVVDSVTYTGLVINASGMGLMQAMWPRIVTQSGEVIYSIDSLDPNYMGAVFMYSPSITVAKSADVGDNPLVLKASSCDDCDVVLDAESIVQLRKAVEINNFLKDGKVSVASGN